MPLRIDTVRALESRRLEIAGETVQADYSRSSMKAIKENILKNFGFWSKTKTSGTLSREHAAGHDTLARIGASLARKPMGPEGSAVMKILERVNKNTMSVVDAMTEIGKLERQFADAHAAAPDLAARAFFTTARKVVLMAPMVGKEIPAKMKQAPKSITDISSQYERLERVFNADTLNEVNDLRSLYTWQQQLATQAGDTELANATQMIVAVLNNKLAMLQELANVSARLAADLPDPQTMQDAASALEAMAEACMVSYGDGGELHNLGRASLIGAVQNGMKAYYSAMHRLDMKRISDLQAQIDQIDFANGLTVDMAAIDALANEISNVSDKMYTQEMQDEATAALQKLRQSAQMKTFVVRLRNLELDFMLGKSVGNAPLAALTAEFGAMQVPSHETVTRSAIEYHVRELWDAMNEYSADRVQTALKPLRAELEAAKGVEEVRACGRKIEAELATQLDFLTNPDTPVSPRMLDTLKKDLNDLSRAAILKEYDLVMDSIDAGGQHTLQELADSLASQAHLNGKALEDAQRDITDTSRTNLRTATRRIDDVDKRVRLFHISDRTQPKTVFAKLQTLADLISQTRATAAKTMLEADRTMVETQCRETETRLAQLYTEMMALFPEGIRISLDAAERRAVGELLRLGGFDTDLSIAVLKLGIEKPDVLRQLSDAVNARMDGPPGAATELFKQMDTLLEMNPDVADLLLQVKLGLAPQMDAKKVRLLHNAAVVRDTFDRTMGEPSKNIAMQRLGIYYVKESAPASTLRYMLGKIGVAGRNRPNNLNMAILRKLWMDELTQGMTDDSPLPDAQARFADFQAKLPEPFKSDPNLFGAMAFDVKELRFVEDFGKSLAALSTTMDGARELQEAFDVCAGQSDVFAAQKALENLTRRYADCKSATGEQLMQSGASVRQGLFAACETLPAELATAFQIEGEPTEEQRTAIAAFAEKAEELRGTSVLLTTRARRQQEAYVDVMGNVAGLQQTVKSVKEVDGGTFKPQRVSGATISVCILALQAAVHGMERDFNAERHSATAEERQAAAQRMQTRYDLLASIRFPEGMQLSSMTSRHKFSMDDEGRQLFALRDKIFHLSGEGLEEKRNLVAIGKEIEQFLAHGNYVNKAKAVLAFKQQDRQGSSQKIWDRAFHHANLSGEKLAPARDMIFAAFPQEIAGQGVRASIAGRTLSTAAKADFEAAKKSLAQTTQAFSGQVRKTLADAVQIAVLDAFLRSDPPIGSAAALKEMIAHMTDQRALRESKFFVQCKQTLCGKLAVPDALATNLLLQFLPTIDDQMFQKMARSGGAQGAHSFVMDLSAADRAPIERLLHREDTLRRSTALVESMTEPDAMVTFDLGMTRGSTVPAVAGIVFSAASRRERALQAGMAVRREGAEFVLTLSPFAAGKMGKRVGEALVGLENAAARAEGAFRDGLELHFENDGKCAQFLADLMSGELEMASFQNCSAIDLLAWKSGALASQRVNLAG